MSSEDIAVVIQSFKRPEYLKWCLRSLERNRGITDYDFIIFQDGAVNPHSGNRLATDEEVDKSIKVAEQANLPNKEIRVYDDNIGIALMRYNILELLNSEYDLIMQIENDVTVGKYGLKVLESLSRQFQNHSPTIHRPRRFKDIRNPYDELNRVRVKHVAFLHTFSLWSHLYQNIRHRWSRYAELCSGYEYSNRPAKEIREEFSQAHTSYSDAIFNSILQENGSGRVIPNVSRAKYIGRYGQSEFPSKYDESQYGLEGPLTFQEDKDITSWQVQYNQV